MWEKYLGNPVLEPGPSGAWDDTHVGVPTVLFNGSEYQMWYQGHGGSHVWKIGYATSADGIVWEKHPKPVLGPGPPGAWDDEYLTSPTVLFDGSEYQMWYSGIEGAYIARTGYATSVDGIEWEKHPDNPVLDLGPSGAWDDKTVEAPAVLFNGTEYHMWYAGSNGLSGIIRIGYATSVDGIVWEKYPGNPVLGPGPPGAWDDWYLHGPTVLFNGTEYQMWYPGKGWANSSGIGYATTITGAGTVTLVDQNPPLTWNYQLTHNSGTITRWMYTGAGITGASVDGNAEAAGWYVSLRVGKQVAFSTTTAMTSGSLTGFHITGTQVGTGSWVAGSNSGGVEGPLPVELSYFNAIVDKFGVKAILKWRTETEVGNIGFAIYRSKEKNGDYTKIAFIPSAGDSEMPIDYQFTDEGVEDGETYFYYLEDVDIAGKKSKSKVIKVSVVPKTVKPALPMPNEFRLLQNFPNPFNPETWIPYKLALNANVTISIYNAKSQLIHTITLSNKQPGVYVTKDKAAYWNGRGSLGEKVSSGMYYYTLQAGDFNATRKMVIVK